METKADPDLEDLLETWDQQDPQDFQETRGHL